MTGLKRWLLILAMFAVTTPICLFTGCGSAEQAANPEQMEQSRQQHIERAKGMQQQMGK